LSQQERRQQPVPVRSRGQKRRRVYTDRQAKAITRTAGCIVMIGLVAWLASQMMGSGPHRDSSGQVTRAGFVTAAGLKIGDCFDAATAGDLYDVTAVPCPQSHTGQVLGFAEMTDSSYPSDAVLQAEVNTDCAPYWQQVNQSGLPSDAANASLVPGSETEFDNGNRKIVCLEQSPSNQLVFSVLD